VERIRKAIGRRVDLVIERVRVVEEDVALFAHGHVFRVFVARWIGLPAAAGCHFLLDTATVSVLSYYRGVPAIKRSERPGRCGRNSNSSPLPSRSSTAAQDLGAREEEESRAP
jgi:broad specificity phosphatase PhoE